MNAEDKATARQSSEKVENENGGNWSAHAVDGGSDNGALTADHMLDDATGMKSSSEGTKRNWKGLLLALLVISVISALIILACFLTYDYKVENNYGIPLTLDDILLLNGLINRPNAQLTNDNLLYIHSNGSLIAINLTTGKKREIMTGSELREKENFTGIVTASDDMRTLLLRYSHIPIYRRSYLAQYQAVYLKDDHIVARIDVGPFNGAIEQPLLSHAQFSPASDYLAFVSKKQLYYLRDPFNPASGNSANPVISKIAKEGVLYGFAGFLYEEEVMGSSQTFWWSPGGEYLAFTAIDESNVTKTKLFYFESPRIVDHSYPIAGETNPHLTLYVHVMATQENIEFVRPSYLHWDAYMVSFKWISGHQFLSGWVSRSWVEGWFIVGDVNTKKMQSIYKETSQSGWVNMPNQLSQIPIVETGGDSILTVIPNYYTNQCYRGIARLSLNISSSASTQYPQWFHTPNYDVTDILHATENDEILYTSTGPDPKEMHLFWTRRGIQTVCLTCGDARCRYNAARVASDGVNILIECLGPSPPSVYLTRLVKSATDPPVYLKIISVISNCSKLKEIIATKAMPVTKFSNITLRQGAKDELTLQVKFTQPPELTEKHIKQYAVLLETYGGPISQIVTAKFSLDWQAFLVARMKFVVVSIDGRGTGNRGKKFESEIYKKLGVVEIKDQLDGLRQILAENRYLNKSQVCSFGWSYGGFTVANLLAHPENDFINCGVAVAPVTDFRLYDSAYSEKFLGLYSENSHEYMRTHVMDLAGNFYNKDFLLIHGMADDNVNIAHSALLMKELIRHGIQFDMMYYPDDNHFIAQRHFRPHLWRKVITFIVDSVNKSSIRHRHILDDF